jgi:cobalamin biosynthetic protein CobC
MAARIAHGGGLIAAQRRHPGAPLPWLDLSTGINPTPYAPPPFPPGTLTRLPEPEELAALEAVAARAYGVGDPACVAAAPGTQALIHLLPRLLPPQSVAVLSPTYAEHAAAWSLSGHTVTEVQTLAEAQHAAVVVVVRPNNPDGQILPAATLLALADALAARGGMLVVDEAFADLEGCTLAPCLPRPGLLLLRSFGKTYGLAGVRLGFALTHPPLAQTLRDALGPWAVSGPAIHAGLHALADTGWRDAAAARLATDAARLDDALHRAGGRVVGGTKLFRLVIHPDAAGLADHLASAGILVRQFGPRPGLLRFGLPGAEADWARLTTALGTATISD